jgi:recombination associated protein RdgC
MVQTQSSPAASMAHWLSTREAPWRFTVDRDCELKTADEQKSSVRYSRHTLEIDEVPQHIAAGKVPTQLALTWNERVSFVLSDAGTIRKLKMLDVVLKEAEDAGGREDDNFDGNAAILTGELSALIPDLIEALGGEGEPAPSQAGEAQAQPA